MIGKSGTGGSFKGLSNYLEGGGQEAEKMEWKEVRNLADDHPGHYTRMMEDTAEMSRAEKPVYHLSVSYSPEDNPSRAAMVNDADSILKHMELDDHQAVIISHTDKDYKHMHLMVNRVNPDTGKAWNPWNDRQKYRLKLREIEASRGYQQLLKMEREPPSIGLTRGEYKQLEQHGVEKMPLKAKTEFYQVHEIFDQAKGWEDVRQSLNEIGLDVRRKGRGGVLHDAASGKTMKLSRVGREYSLGRLESKFGKHKEFTRVMEATKGLDKAIPDRNLRAAFSKFARSQFSSKATQKAAAEGLKQAARGASKLGKTAKSLTSLAASSNPVSGAAKMGVGIVKKAMKLTKTQDRGMSR